MLVVQICISTGASEYIATKPAASYKKLFIHVMEQTDISYEVSCVLDSKAAAMPRCPL